MRSIPFKVICMLGMNDTAFPRHDAPPAFDLAAAQPRAGDRNLRDDDRHLFLETLLSARETLYISYVGLSNRDNKESPPCAPVGELLDYLDARFPPPEGGLRRESLVRRHRLQPFSSAYFQPGASCSATPGKTGAPASRPAFLARVRRSSRQRLSPSPNRNGANSTGKASPNSLKTPPVTSLANGSASGFRARRPPLRIATANARRSRRYGFEEDLTRQAVATGHLQSEALKIARATGALPPGYPGDSDFKTLNRSAVAAAGRIRARIHGEAIAPISVDLAFGDWHLSGVLRDVYPGALLRHRAAAVKAKHLLNSWIAHLVLQCVAPSGGPPETLLFGSDKTVTFLPLSDPIAALRDLIDLYAAGLRSPLPFFPESSCEFARRMNQPTKRGHSSPLEPPE